MTPREIAAAFRDAMKRIARRALFSDRHTGIEAEALVRVSDYLQPVVGFDPDTGRLVPVGPIAVRRIVTHPTSVLISQVAGNITRTVARPGAPTAPYTRRIRTLILESATYTPGAAPQVMYALNVAGVAAAANTRVAVLTTPVATDTNELLTKKVTIVIRDDDTEDVVLSVVGGQAAESWSLSAFLQDEDVIE